MTTQPAASTLWPDPFGQAGGGGGGAAGGGAGEAQQAGPTERHHAALPSQLQFLRQERLVAAVHQVPDHRMLRAVGLHQHLARPFPPPGAAGELQQQLQALLGGTQIGAVQQTVGGQHRRQRHPGQIHALGQHLGADQHVRLPGGEALEQTAVAIPAPGGVPVEADQAQTLQLPRQLLHHPLGAGAEGLEGGGAAVAAAVVHLLAVVAPVAAQPFPRPFPPARGPRCTVRATSQWGQSTTSPQLRQLRNER